MKFDRDHLKKLQQCRSRFYPDEEPAAGNPAEWLKYVSADRDCSSLPAKKCRRVDVFQYVGQGTPADLACAAILAWGGMHRQHGKKLFATTEWLEVAERIRVGELNRSQAYDAFAELRRRGEAPGMGPAYFTKLIFFLAPQTSGSPARGYIMDQWTACSINLLLGAPAAVLTDCSYSWNKRGELEAQYTVSNCNDGARYERFCAAVEELAGLLSLSPLETELLLLSEGGKQPLMWRSYVKELRRPAFA